MADKTLEFSPAQKRALEIYKNSATMYNDYKPCSIEAIAKQLKEEGYEASSSSVQRWKKKFDFDSYLDLELQSVMVKDNSIIIAQQATAGAAKKTVVDLEKNAALMGECHDLLQLFVKQTKEVYQKTKHIKNADAKLTLAIYTQCGTREDKFLDRVANSGGDKLNSDEILQEISAIDVDIED